MDKDLRFVRQKKLPLTMHLQNTGQDIVTSALATWHQRLGLDSFYGAIR